MQDLIKQERFEIEVLEKLNSRKFLNNLTFGGGTMLRLCFGLNRYSVDLDFWLTKKIDKKKLYREIKAYLAGQYVLKDSADKFYTVLFELKSKDYPRSLKIEIRKEIKKVKTEQAIAYSRYSNGQVFLKIVSLESMMESKIKAFLDRKEIRQNLVVNCCQAYKLFVFWKSHNYCPNIVFLHFLHYPVFHSRIIF